MYVMISDSEMRATLGRLHRISSDVIRWISTVGPISLASHSHAVYTDIA